jgi:hypothetical protein
MLYRSRPPGDSEPSSTAQPQRVYQPAYHAEEGVGVIAMLFVLVGLQSSGIAWWVRGAGRGGGCRRRWRFGRPARAGGAGPGFRVGVAHVEILKKGIPGRYLLPGQGIEKRNGAATDWRDIAQLLTM